MKTIKWGLVGLVYCMSFSAHADLAKSQGNSNTILQIQTDSKASPYDTTHTDKESKNTTGLKFKSSSTSVQLYGTVDIGYEHWSQKSVPH
ncbi:MAG: hypothetical protein H6R05_896 [Burkholderiaceae bacterium]|nr:hypothetical protein [Burkholderiaceae bacterium]